MEYKTILYEVVNNVGVITLNRPKNLNAYTVEMGEELVEVFNLAKIDPQVRVVVLTGAGMGFCAGVDLEVLKDQRAGKPISGTRLGEEYFVRGFCKDLRDFPKPTLVAFNGTAIGIGVTMSLPCDIRIAASSAEFGVPFAKLGIVPGLGSTYLLPEVVGVQIAKELLFSAKSISAEEAFRIGLVNHVVPDEELSDLVYQLAADIAYCPPEAIEATKRALNYSSGNCSFEDAMAMEHVLNQELNDSRA